MPQKNVYLEDEVYEEVVKQKEEGQSITQFIRTAIREYLGLEGDMKLKAEFVDEHKEELKELAEKDLLEALEGIIQE